MKTRAHSDRLGAAVCLLGIALNLALAAAKIALGLLSGSVSIAADGFNNVSDCGSGAVALISMRIARKPADREHPYGHRRAEYIASMVAGFLVLALAVELLTGSVGSLVRGAVPSGGTVVYAVLAGSVAVKCAMLALYRVAAKRLGSEVLRAAAIDSLCDCFATLAVVAGVLLFPVFPAADGTVGILVSLFIGWQGGKLIAEASSQLLGRADPALSARIKEIFLSAEGILGVHDLNLYSYGKGVTFATLHAEMDANLTALAAHTVIDGLERQVKIQTGVQLTVHLDPVDLSNREESQLKLQMTEAAHRICAEAELHDFRLIPETRRVEFDVGLPYAFRPTDAEISAALCSCLKELGDYEPVITIERE